MGKYKNIEEVFGSLKRYPKNEKYLTDLSNILTEEFKKTIVCSLCNNNFPVGRFVMSVTPMNAALDKIVEFAVDNSNKVDVLVDMWKASNTWSVEISKGVLSRLHPKELTALTCHEIFHTIYSDRTVKRLYDALAYAINIGGVTSRTMLTTDRFRTLLRLPGIISCQMLFDRKEITLEARQCKEWLESQMFEDKFFNEKGYRTNLINAIDILDRSIEWNKDRKKKSAASVGVEYTMGVLSDVARNRTDLARNKVVSLKKVMPGQKIVTEAVDDILQDVFDRDVHFMEDVMDQVKERVFEEHGLFTKRLAPIEMNQVDYAYVKCEAIKTTGDKMMVLSYVNSKIELCDYYMEILDNPKLSKKYIVPHKRSDLERIKTNLLAIREKAMSKRINEDNRNVIVYYPSGYEG